MKKRIHQPSGNGLRELNVLATTSSTSHEFSAILTVDQSRLLLTYLESLENSLLPRNMSLVSKESQRLSPRTVAYSLLLEVRSKQTSHLSLLVTLTNVHTNSSQTTSDSSRQHKQSQQVKPPYSSQSEVDFYDQLFGLGDVFIIISE